MQKKQFPPVSLVKEDISEFYAITTDIFHVHHLYVTQKVNSKKKVVGFLSFKTQPNLSRQYPRDQYDSNPERSTGPVVCLLVDGHYRNFGCFGSCL